MNAPTRLSPPSRCGQHRVRCERPGPARALLTGDARHPVPNRRACRVHGCGGHRRCSKPVLPYRTPRPCTPTVARGQFRSLPFCSTPFGRAACASREAELNLGRLLDVAANFTERGRAVRMGDVPAAEAAAEELLLDVRARRAWPDPAQCRCSARVRARLSLPRDGSHDRRVPRLGRGSRRAAVPRWCGCAGKHAVVDARGGAGQRSDGVA